MQPIHPDALFKLTVLGPLASRTQLERGELRRLIRELAAKPYAIPGSRNTYLDEKTIERWFYLWRAGGIEALQPKPRSDRGASKIRPSLQEAILQAKREQPARSLQELLRLLEDSGQVAIGELSRSSLHRLLRSHGLSRPPGSSQEMVERRRFEAEHAGDLWYGDVMHGPKVRVDGRLRKVYLVSLMDDASRLIPHSAFCTGETALDIEGVLKQAIMRRGLPTKLVIDHGAAYRAQSLQGICARLEIRLVYCRPYEPQSKGKIERWHRTLRSQFLAELNTDSLQDLADLNARLWAWLEEVYHAREHGSLAGLTPLQRWRADLARVRPLGAMALHLDDIFHHRATRKVRQDGTVSWDGRLFEVPYELAGRWVVLVVDPHQRQVSGVEDAQGQPLGKATPLDAQANSRRRRIRPREGDTTTPEPARTSLNAVELAYEKHCARLVTPLASSAREDAE
jgi:putative transposase